MNKNVGIKFWLLVFTFDILMSKNHLCRLLKSLLATVEQLVKVQSKKEYYDFELVLGTEVVRIAMPFLLFFQVIVIGMYYLALYQTNIYINNVFDKMTVPYLFFSKCQKLYIFDKLTVM